MNKTKLIALILLLSFVLLGTGYAYWSEAITIETTVSTGELKVEFEPYDNIIDVDAPYVFYNEDTYSFPDYRIAPFTLRDNNHTLSASFIDVFPGLYYSVPFKMSNKGTIPAVFKGCTVTWDIIDSSLKPGESESALLTQLQNNLKVSNLYFKVFDSNDIQVGSSIPCVNGPSISLGQLAGRVYTTLTNANIRLEPGQYLQIISDQGHSIDGIANKLGGNLKFLFNKNFDNDFENRQFTVDINIEWTQFNALN